MEQLVQIYDYICYALSIAIVLRALYSWYDSTYQGPIGRILFRITEPLIAPIRRYFPQTGGFDLAPIMAILLIQLSQRLVHNVVL